MGSFKTWQRGALLLVVGLVLVTGLLMFVGVLPAPWHDKSANASAQTPTPNATTPGVELVAPSTLMVPESVRKCLGMCKGNVDAIAVAQAPTQSQTMVLPGSTALDPTRLWRIRARFAPARVVEIAPVVDEAASLKEGRTVTRELRSGDRVQKGDLLGVFYSVDVGNKKNDLIDALVQLKLDQDILDRAEKAFKTGAIPEVFLLNARRNVEGDQNAIVRAVNTLRTWDLPEADIQAVYKEAEEVRKRHGKRDRDKEKDWPKVELRAPEEGTIVERNVAQHEMVVDNTVNLFQIAKVDRLLVLANAPEDDLPTLERLTSPQRKWTVNTVGSGMKEGIPGPIDEIGYLIDPNQHTAVIKGHIPNPDRRMRAGQFVSATVQVPPPDGVVEVPIEALVEDGKQCYVFVQTDAQKHHYTMRRVQVTHRFAKSAFVRSEPFTKKEQRTHEEEEQGIPAKEPLHKGERVLVCGAIELKAELNEKESQPKKDDKSDARVSRD